MISQSAAIPHFAPLALVWLALFTALAVGLGRPVICWLDRGTSLTRQESLGAAFLIGAGALSHATWAIGSIRLDTSTMVIMLAAIAPLSLWGLRGIGVWLRPTHPWQGWERVLVGISLLAGLNLILNALAPPADFDSLNYHISLPLRDLEQGFIAPRHDVTYAFFPALCENLFRLALATAGDGAAQGVHALFGVTAAMGASALTLRLGAGRIAALIAFILFCAIRLVVWEAGSAQVELALAANATWALLAARSAATTRDGRLAVLAGLFLGLTILSKYLGLALALVMGLVLLADLVRRRISFLSLGLATMAGLLVVAPLLVRNFSATGNPLFPLLNPLFSKDLVPLFDTLSGAWGRGERSIINLLLAPWDISVLSSRYFDGQIFGFPYLLALAPLGLATLTDKGRNWREWIFLSGYFGLWFFALSQQIRFLSPILPLVSALSAAGLAGIAVSLAGRRWWILPFAILGLVAFLNQAMFVGVYALMRYPAGLGLQSARAYLATPSIDGSHIEACTFLRQHLKPGQTYVMSTDIHSYYCPQMPMLTDWLPHEAKQSYRPNPPVLDTQAMVDAIIRYDIAYLMVSTASEVRHTGNGQVNAEIRPIEGARLLAPLSAAIAATKPVMTEARLAVYDSRDVLAQLKP